MPLTRRRLLTGTAALLATATLPTPHLRAAPRLKAFHALGTTVRFWGWHEDERLARAAAAEAVRAVFAIHEAMTPFEPSPLRRVNELAHERAVEVPRVLFGLLQRCQALYEETGGRFDVTVGGLMAWRRRVRSGAIPRLPAMQAALAGVGMDNLVLEPETRRVRLAHPATQLDLGGVAKGFAVDQAIAAFRARGVTNVLVEAGGDLYASGFPNPGTVGWAVDIADPRGGRPLRTVTVTDRAVATSGNYHQPAPHLLDPHSGSTPAVVRSATVLAPDTTTADAWATACFVGAPDATRALLAARPELSALLVLSDDRVVDLSIP